MGAPAGVSRYVAELKHGSREPAAALKASIANSVGWLRKAAGDGVFDPDVFVERFPPQGTALQAESDSCEFRLGRAGQQRKFFDGKAHHALVG